MTSYLLYLVQGNYLTNDSLGNNPGHGGYSESNKSKGINPKYITGSKSACVDPVKATASASIGKDCSPCGETQYVRVDIKGSPALRFLKKTYMLLETVAQYVVQTDDSC